MIYILNMILMLLAIAVLSGFLWCTRRYDDVLWWALRFLLTHSLISLFYMTYDAVDSGFELSLQLVLIRWGFVSMVLALALLWYLLRRQHKHFKQTRFNDRIAQIFKDTQ